MHDPDYWEERKGFRYYREVFEICVRLGISIQSAIDVGCRSTRFLEWLTWIPFRVALDIVEPAVMQDVRTIQEDFLTWKPIRHFDLVLCLQVLEHIKNNDVENFAKKLLTIGNTILISVPYKWSEDNCIHHLQDPVTVDKLENWFGRTFTEARIVEDKGMKRLIAMYANS